MSKPASKSRISPMTRPTVASSFSAGTIASRLSSASWARTESRGGAGISTSSATGGHRCPDADEIEDLTGAMRVRVLVEDAFAGASAHLLGRGGIAEQLPVSRRRFVGGGHNAHLSSRLEPPLDSFVRIGDDRCAGGRKLERTASR